MDTQLRRWSRAAGAVLGGVVLVTAIPVWVMWRDVLSSGPVLPSGAWSGMWTLLWWAAGEFAGCLAVLALASLISRRLLGGRRPLVVGAVLTLVAILAAEWFGFPDSMLSPVGYLFGVSQLLNTMSIPMVAGAWVLRPPAREPVTVADSADFEGIWESGRGVLTLEPDAGFALLLDGRDEPVAGVWRREPGRPPVLSLRVSGPTGLGHGWQTTLLEVEYGPDGSTLLRLDDRTTFTRRRPLADVEHAGGYIGRLEVLES